MSLSDGQRSMPPAAASSPNKKDLPMTDSDSCAEPAADSAMQRPHRKDLVPPVTLNDRAIIFMAVQGSAQMPNATPLRIAWCASQADLLEDYVIRPMPDWADKAWDYEHTNDHGATREDLLQFGVPAERVAKLAQAATKGRCLVMHLPGLERLWLTELLTLQAEDICFETTDVIGLALQIASHCGLDDNTFVDIVTDGWAKLLLKRKEPDDWAKAAPVLIQLLLDEAVRSGKINPAEPIRLKSRAMERRLVRKGSLT